ncbi:MAG: SusC/RagA family TonB-linked outer membrane protein, partial [Duncaniella sp.]|nr:SusC/RagA family TonB-linked outer membrane protein [Duncaniella sp.]
IFGTGYERDDNGNLYLDADGLPVATGDSKVIGKCTPDFNMGFNLSLRYKRVSLSTTWSWQSGGQMYCGTNLVMNMFGATEATLDRDKPMTMTGTNINTGEPMTAEVSLEDYWNVVGDISEAAVYDTDFLKMRDLTLTYQLPRIGIFDISVYGFARNVFVWAKMPNLDPESSIGNNNSGGYFERFSIPNTASFGGGLKVVF